MKVYNKVRKELDILSKNGKNSWSDDMRGGRFGFMKLEHFNNHYEVMKKFKFEMVKEDEVKCVWKFEDVNMSFEKMNDVVWVNVW